MNIKGAIFDLDGTLLESMHIWNSVASTYLKKQGKIPEVGIDKKFLNMSVTDSAKYIKERYSIPGTLQNIVDGINELVEDFYFNHAETKEGIPELLKKLAERGVKMSVATATDRYLVEATLEKNNIKNYFCEIVTSTEVGSGKYNPAIYEAALKPLNTKKSETIVFEDLLLGIKTAKAAGFTVAGIYDSFAEDTQSEVERISDWYIKNYYDWIEKALKE